MLTLIATSGCDNVAIDKNGQLSTTELIDREESDLIECVVTARDSGTPTRSSSTSVRFKFALFLKAMKLNFFKFLDQNQRSRR